ncbi:MAG TPA: Clp protease N-terminal domain-containing protein [Streptosporangiaceae bacterium]|nr:Clp protease N-terminal domain-containing protein [Streptosporangiaceae bacterium]
MTPPPTLQELIDTVRRDAQTDDPIGQLAVASATASDLEQTTDALLGHFVDRCRRAGRSWSEISAALGVTKQAVHKRFAGPLAEQLAKSTDRPTFEHFTPRARNLLAAANAAAMASGHRQIETGHLLLGLYADPDAIAAKVLADLQVSRTQVEGALRAAWARAAGPQDEPMLPAGAADAQSGAPDTGTGTAAQTASRLPMSESGRTVLVNAVAVALEFGHNYVGTEHILLALYRDPDSLAARVLTAAGAERGQAEVRVRELLHGYTKP